VRVARILHHDPIVLVEAGKTRGAIASSGTP